jgi:apolipoprotein N-acyltransferase
VSPVPNGALFRILPLLLAALAGALSVLGFAPFYLFPLPFATLALLIVLWRRANSRRHAMLIGFVFGLGYFLTGVSWVYVSLHDFGAMPALLAIFVTCIFCCILAAYPAVVGYAYFALGPRSALATLVVLPALWTLGEWVRGWLFTGFPWIALGYAQVPTSPLAGYVPVLGVFGASFATVLTAGLLVTWCWFPTPKDEWPEATSGGMARGHVGMNGPRPRGAEGKTRLRLRYFILHPSSFILAFLWLGGYLLQQITWTTPSGAPISVSLLQGNIPQELKWRPDRIISTLDAYRDLVVASHARLIVLPETALPLFLHEVPADYLAGLAAHARSNGGDVLIGVPERTGGGYYNSVLSFGMAPTQTYRKSHLVPFGEFVPMKLLFGWFFEVTQIPLLDFARGADTQQPLDVAGQRVAVDICYEDAFGEDIIRQLPQATVLVNVSNVAWFGRSVAPQQHLQISQTRALESGRYMLRATNTGMTAIIDQRGNVQQAAPEFERAVVNGDVQGYAGATPFVRWGNLPIIVLALVLALGGGWLVVRGNSKIRDLPTR